MEIQYIDKAQEGKAQFSLVFITFAMVVVAYAIIGQIPLTISILQTGISFEEHLDLKLLGEMIGKTTLLFYLIIPFIFGFVALLVAIKYIHKRSVLSLFTIRKTIDWKRFFTSFFIWGSVLSLSLWVNHLTTGNISWNFNPSLFFPLLIVALVLIPIQTTFEEILFRGYLTQELQSVVKKPLISMLISAILFGLMHASNPEIEILGYGVLSYYMLSGLFLGFITFYDDGIELAMGYHAMNNIFAAVLLTNNWQVFQTDALFMDLNPPSFSWEAILTLVILQPLLFFVFAKRYRWNWKSRKLI